MRYPPPAVKQLSQSYKSGVLSLVEVAEPRVSAGSVLVDTSVSLISAGTERSIVDTARKSLLGKARERPDLVQRVLDKARREGVLAAFEAVRTKLDNPIPLGYSLAGRAVDVGREVAGIRRGDRVACAGAGWASHAEANVVPQNLLVPIPEEVSDEEASFATVAAIALHGVRMLEPTLGETVAVLGLGLLGQLAVSLLAAHGCDVVGIDLDEKKVARSLDRGARSGAVVGRDDPAEVVRAATGGKGADAVLVCASAPNNEPLVTAGTIARDRGRIAVVGLLPLEVPRALWYEKELSLLISRSYGPGRYDDEYELRGRDYPIGYVRWTERRNLAAVLRAIATRRLEVRSLITHRFPFTEALDAYKVITGERPEPHLAVLLTYPERPRAEPAVVTPSAPARGGSQVGVAVVGTGAFATSVLMPALGELSSAKRVATCSARGLSARHAADRYGFEKVASSLEEVLAMHEVSAVLLATRHAAHASQAAKVLRSGRDVFLEKPAAVDEEQLALLGEAVKASGRLLQVGFNRRYAPLAKELKEAFASRRTGLVMHARINAGRMPEGHWVFAEGGRIIGEGCHFIDLMTYWAGAPPVRVSAHAVAPGQGYLPEDNVVVTLSFADGSVGTLTYTSQGDPTAGKEHYTVFGEGTVAQLEDWRALTLTARGKTRTRRALKADKGHGAQLEAFVQSCLGRTAPTMSWTEVEAVTRATFAVELARRNEVTVDLRPESTSA